MSTPSARRPPSPSCPSAAPGPSPYTASGPKTPFVLPWNDAICATTATIASNFAFNETIASWLEQHGVPASLARHYIARLFLGVTTGAAEEPDRSFRSLAATHATAGGIHEQFLEHLVGHRFLTSVSEALDAVQQRITAEL